MIYEKHPSTRLSHSLTMALAPLSDSLGEALGQVPETARAYKMAQTLALFTVGATCPALGANRDLHDEQGHHLCGGPLSCTLDTLQILTTLQLLAQTNPVALEKIYTEFKPLLTEVAETLGVEIVFGTIVSGPAIIPQAFEKVDLCFQSFRSIGQVSGIGKAVKNIVELFFRSRASEENSN